jgi:Na+/melibiose symporter-like transporter
LEGTAALIVVGLAFAYFSVFGDEDAEVVGYVIVTLVAIAISAFLTLWPCRRRRPSPGPTDRPVLHSSSASWPS